MGTSIKHALFEACQTHVENRIDQARHAMEMAQAAANEEAKSSVGDKYETGRSMMQLERDKHAVQLAEALKLKKVLEQVDVEKTNGSVQLGSLVITSEGNFFIAVSIGKIKVADTFYFAISASSPVGARLIDKTVGEKIEYNGRLFKVLEVQ